MCHSEYQVAGAALSKASDGSPCSFSEVTGRLFAWTSMRVDPVVSCILQDASPVARAIAHTAAGTYLHQSLPGHGMLAAEHLVAYHDVPPAASGKIVSDM